MQPQDTSSLEASWAVRYMAHSPPTCGAWPAAAAAAAGHAPQVGGEWAMYRTAQDASKLDVSWRLLHLEQAGFEVSGAILKTSGDSGALVGRWRDGRLTMSHFAGDPAAGLEAQLNPRRHTQYHARSAGFTLPGRTQRRAGGQRYSRAAGLVTFHRRQESGEPFHFSGPDSRRGHWCPMRMRDFAAAW